MAMGVERLHELFEENENKDGLGFEGTCHDCGQPVMVNISLEPEGFKIQGGAVYEPEPQKYFNKCDGCYQINPQLTNFRSCEVYSRVVGYLRPVAQWNDGKQNEFQNRKTFEVPQA